MIRLSVVARSVVLVVGFIAATVLVLNLATGRLLGQKIVAEALAAQETGLRVAAGMLDQAGMGVAVTTDSQGHVTRLEMLSMPEFRRHSVTDDIGDVTGAVATIFAWEEARRDFIRVSTNLRGADGKRQIGTGLGRTGPVHQAARAGEAFQGDADVLGTLHFARYQPIFGPSGDVIGILAAAVSRQRFDDALASLQRSVLLIAVPTLVLSSVLAALAFRWMLAPLGRLTGAVTRLADGDLSVEVATTGSEDEIDRMAGAVAVFRENAVEKKALEDRAAAEADRQKAERARQALELSQRIETELGAIGQDLTTAAGDLQATARELSGLAGTTSQQASAVSAASTQASANVETVAAAAQELAGSIDDIARQVGHQNTIADQAKTGAEESHAQVQSLADEARDIGQIVELITSIAEQTNLLALNATIEAARAGDAGKGFAVVAAEVKNLANQTAQATDRIASQVRSIQDKTGTAVEAIQGIDARIHEMTEIAATVAAAVEEQGAATAEISRNVSEAAAGTREVSAGIDKVLDEALTTGERAQALLQASEHLSREARDLDQQTRALATELAAGA